MLEKYNGFHNKSAKVTAFRGVLLLFVTINVTTVGFRKALRILRKLPKNTGRFDLLVKTGGQYILPVKRAALTWFSDVVCDLAKWICRKQPQTLQNCFSLGNGNKDCAAALAVTTVSGWISLRLLVRWWEDDPIGIAPSTNFNPRNAITPWIAHCG